MNDNALLMLAGSKKVKSTIGEQGQLGFGGGLYGGDPADLEAIGLSPLPNNDDPTNENYGSYRHTNGSVMLFIPAFCYRVGNPGAPSYSRDKENALEIRDAIPLGMHVGSTDVFWTPGDGWVLHRAFIDGGVLKSGFFLDKYLCSKDTTGKLAISVKGGDPINLHWGYVNSSTMPDCSGKVWDAITLGRARGSAYSCASAFMYSAIAVLALAHGQATKSTSSCAWFDPNYQTNYPKGNNNYLKDIDEPSLTFTQGQGNTTSMAKTGSASSLSKTTHTGQVWGVTDVNGNAWQPCLGVAPFHDKRLGFAKDTVFMHNFTKDNLQDFSLFTDVTTNIAESTVYWGSNALSGTSSGGTRAMFGVNPRRLASIDDNKAIFGGDTVDLRYHADRVLWVSGTYRDQKAAGIFYRSYIGYWGSGEAISGFRVGGYAN